MNRAKYFDSRGHEVDESTALRNGVLRDSYRVTVPTMFRDSTRGARFVDGSGKPLDLTAGNRPGYRISTDDAGRRHIEESRFRADRAACNQWRCGDGQRVCPDCDGDGEDDDGVCETCGGDGVVESTRKRSTGKGFGSGNEGHRSEDIRSVTRGQAYRDYDQALSSAWQNGRTG
jgi:hypothetical protein